VLPLFTALAVAAEATTSPRARITRVARIMTNGETVVNSGGVDSILQKKKKHVAIPESTVYFSSPRRMRRAERRQNESPRLESPIS
jgi:hypothetical protein